MRRSSTRVVFLVIFILIYVLVGAVVLSYLETDLELLMMKDAKQSVASFLVDNTCLTGRKGNC